MKMPIPNDWDSSTFCDYLVRWPDSTLWRIILRGLLSNPSIEAFWDEATGNVADVIEAFTPALDQNLDELECTNMNIPVGTIWQFAGETPPDKWHFCWGQTMTREGFPELFAAIGTLYGAPSGETFKIPDLRGRVSVGIDPAGQVEFDTLGETGGEKTHTLTTGEMPTHTHAQNSHNHAQNSHNHNQNSHNHAQNAHDHTIWANQAAGGGGGVRNPAPSSGTVNVTSEQVTPTNVAATATNIAATATNIAATATNQNEGSGLAHNNLQPYLVLNYMIRSDP